MTTKSKKTIAAEVALAELQAKLTEARGAVENALAVDTDGSRLPRLRGEVDVLTRRLADAGKALHAAQVSDCLAAIKAATSNHAEALKAYQIAKGKHLDACIAAAEKPSVGRTLGKTRHLWPKWLTDFQKARHATFAHLCEAYENLRSLDPAAAAKAGWNRLEDFTPPAAGRIEV